jgi:hypothetical protein
MDTKQEDLPPKTVKAQLVRLDDNLRRLERAQFAGVQRAPGSLPVLEAFQLFLENERKHTQRRILCITAGAIFAILLSVIGSGLYIRYALRNANSKTDALASTTESLQTSMGELASSQDATRLALKNAARNLVEQQQNLEKQTRVIASKLQSTAGSQATQASEVVRLREQLEQILMEQKSMQELLNNQNVRRPASLRQETAPPATIAETIGPFRRREENTSTAKPSTQQRVRYAVVTLEPEGRAGVRWMLPIENDPE